MDVAAIFDYVRTSLDSDDTELPDTLLGAWLNAAEQRCFAALRSAERLFTGEEQLDADGTTQAFPVAETEVRTVIGLVGEQWLLTPLPHDFALERWPRNAAEGVPVDFGLSTHWSVDEASGHVWLWPAPNNGAQFLVTGLTSPTPVDFTDTTNVPVLPARYHALLSEYVTSRGAEMQQNLSLASMKMNRFEAELDALGRVDLRPSAAGVVTVGSVQLRGPDVTPDRLAWPWE